MAIAGTIQKKSATRSTLSKWSVVLESGGLLIILAALILFFGLNPTSGSAFLSGANITNLLGNQSVTGIVALAMVIPLVSGYFDLSVAAVAGMANVTVAATMSSYGLPIYAALLIGIAVALVAGCINGYLVAGLRLNGFIVTLGTYTLIGGLLQFYTNGHSIYENIPVALGEWGMIKIFGVPSPFFLLISVAIVAWYILMHTPFGRRLEAIGSNESAARLVGIRVDRSIFTSFVLSSLLAGVAGVLLTSRSGGADPNAAPAYLFPALTAVFLGATAIRPGRYNVWGTIIGVFLVAIAVNGLTLMGADTWITPVFNGAALVGAIAVSTLIGRHRARAADRTSANDEYGRGPSSSGGESPTSGAELTRNGARS
ncbi:ABC transporter permease [Arthrobacter sp. CC3]|uniref:ABC transporter permease n=1 Tax=Arthrobacter sp. CC3 TaxID=3029185 RepID=UPI003265A731